MNLILCNIPESKVRSMDLLSSHKSADWNPSKLLVAPWIDRFTNTAYHVYNSSLLASCSHISCGINGFRAGLREDGKENRKKKGQIYSKRERIIQRASPFCPSILQLPSTPSHNSYLCVNVVVVKPGLYMDSAIEGGPAKLYSRHSFWIAHSRCRQRTRRSWCSEMLQCHSATQEFDNISKCFIFAKYFLNKNIAKSNDMLSRSNEGLKREVVYCSSADTSEWHQRLVSQLLN